MLILNKPLKTPQATLVGEELLLQVGSTPLPKRILMHCCCGPCAEWPLYYLRTYGVEPDGFFFNPNIHPETEWEKRVASFQEMGRLHHWFTQIKGSSQEETWRGFCSEDKKYHCDRCYALRLQESAKQASEQGYIGFTTSLLVSPYQDAEQIHWTGQRMAERYGVEYFAFDFTPGYHRGQEMAKADGLYRQRFCGCIYSLGESSFCNKISRSLGIDPEQIPARRAVPKGFVVP